MNPTPEQSAIVSAGRSSPSSLMIGAYAGTGKTTMLKMLAPELTGKPILALAFNKRNAVDLEKALPSHVTCKTFNSLGHGAFSSAIGRRLVVDSGKMGKLTTAYTKTLGGAVSQDEWSNLRQIASFAKTAGLIPAAFPQARKSLLPDDSCGWGEIADFLMLDLTEELMVGARKILSSSIRQALDGTIDYDDQIYMSTLFTGLYPKFSTVLVDESQDQNVLNRIQIQKSCTKRLIVVGDPKQAIYAFRGADANSMEMLRTLREDWIDLPLTISFRCPKKIVERQRKHAPEFSAAPSAPEGSVLDWRQEERWTIISNVPVVHADKVTIDPKYPQDINWFDVGSGKDVAILCRNNAPLITLAFRLISKRIGVSVLGRDFGKSLLSVLKKACGEDDSLPFDEAVQRLLEWKDQQIRLARANDKEEKIGRIADQADSILAVMESGQASTLSDVKRWLAELFEENTGKVILSTGHKAKGMEWHTVLHLDPWRVPSKWSRLALDEGNEIPYQQEMNLKYVIETRAKDTLILANLENFA